MIASYATYESLRDKKGVKDAQVANAAGIALATLIAWRKEEYSPKVDKIMKIAAYFEVPLETFYAADATK